MGLIETLLWYLRSYYCSGCRRQIKRWRGKAATRMRGDGHRWPTLLCPRCAGWEVADAGK